MEKKSIEEKFKKKNATQLTEINEKISKVTQRDVRLYNTKKIARIIEENKGMKVLRKRLSESKKQISKIADKNGQIKTNKQDILNIVRVLRGTL